MTGCLVSSSGASPTSKPGVRGSSPLGRAGFRAEEQGAENQSRSVESGLRPHCVPTQSRPQLRARAVGPMERRLSRFRTHELVLIGLLAAWVGPIAWPRKTPFQVVRRGPGLNGLTTLSDLSPEFVKHLRARLEAKLSPEPNTGCYLWTGAAHEDGYGHINVAGRTANAHRVTWILEHGDITAESVIDHLCRQPACCNPAHLENVSQVENLRRGLLGVLAVPRTTCKRGHDLTTPRALTPSAGCRVCWNTSCRLRSAQRRSLARDAASLEATS